MRLRRGSIVLAEALVADKKRQTYTRVRSLDKEGALNRVRAELGEQFDDYLVIVRSRNPDKLSWAYTDATWADGALNRMSRELP